MLDGKAWIAQARDIAKAHDLQACCIVTVHRDGTIAWHTYGENRKKCGVIGRWMKAWMERAITAVPFRTVFGWGNAGVAKPLTVSELSDMHPSVIAWVNEIEGSKHRRLEGDA